MFKTRFAKQKIENINTLWLFKNIINNYTTFYFIYLHKVHDTWI